MTGKCVDDEATEEATYNANNSGNWDGVCRLAEGNTSDKNNSFQALTQHGTAVAFCEGAAAPKACPVS
jgi:hypothetical protein